MDDLYGLLNGDLEAAARRLAEHIGPGEPHESDYLGADYYLWRPSEAEVPLLHNRELDDELAEPAYADYPLLVRVWGIDTFQRWKSIAASVGLDSLRVDRAS